MNWETIKTYHVLAAGKDVKVEEKIRTIEENVTRVLEIALAINGKSLDDITEKQVTLIDDPKRPERATKYSAGYDICANETVTIPPGECMVVKTGVSFTGLDPDKYIQLSLRSGVSLKRPFLMANGYGLIDSDYERQEIGLILYNRGKIPATVDKGDRMAQAVVVKYFTETEEKEITTERTGGYGSTGN